MLGMQLHFFCDASSYARGCVCYMRITHEDGGIDCNILTGKSLLADDGKRTIPQLELEAALEKRARFGRLHDYVLVKFVSGFA